MLEDSAVVGCKSRPDDGFALSLAARIHGGRPCGHFPKSPLSDNLRTALRYRLDKIRDKRQSGMLVGPGS